MHTAGGPSSQELAAELFFFLMSALLQEGECNYFKGIMLLLSYLIVAASFYVHSDSCKQANSGASRGPMPWSLSPVLLSESMSMGKMW